MTSGMSSHENSHSGSDTPAPLRSKFAGDEDMAELVEFFVNEMQNRVAGIEAAFSSGDERRFREIAHQLKGAAACYGYPSITDSAAELESTLMAEEAELSALGEKVEDLLSLCRRAAAGGSDS
jgi:HPt (histidine-containing phosphotransfer) domain-containing protein